MTSETARATQQPLPLVLTPAAMVRVRYTNWRDETSDRTLGIAGAPTWASTKWHPEPQWLVPALDADKPGDGVRWFALRDMHPIEIEEEPAP